MEPLYLSIPAGEFKERIKELKDLLKSCNLCGRECGTDRYKERGFCNAEERMEVASVNPHYGEEKPLVGRSGSGTIFLSNCTCRCVYCQNWNISQGGEGRFMSEEEVAEKMLYLQELGCNNVNWVTPTQYIPQLVSSLFLARERGLNIPIVYNTGGYDNPEVIEMLSGIVDIYMPDVKYGSNENAEKYSEVKRYWEIVRECLREMHSQVGDLKINKKGIAVRGLLVRHLVLPGGIAESDKVLKFIAEEISVDSYVNIMDQYRPCYNARKYRELSRGITLQEYREVKDIAENLGLHRGFQGM